MAKTKGHKALRHLQGHRWFIWTILVSVVALGGLATYIYSVNEKDGVEVSGEFYDYKEISQQQALDSVNEFPEVASYINRVKARKGVPSVSISSTTSSDTEGAYWTVRVFEEVKGKTTTFGTYKVYVKGGKTVKQ